jgi:hypothetical protein
MRKIIACLFTLALLAVPASAGAAGPPNLHQLGCDVQKKLGVDNVAACDF